MFEHLWNCPYNSLSHTPLGTASYLVTPMLFFLGVSFLAPILATTIFWQCIGSLSHWSEWLCFNSLLNISPPHSPPHPLSLSFSSLSYTHIHMVSVMDNQENLSHTKYFYKRAFNSDDRLQIWWNTWGVTCGHGRNPEISSIRKLLPS